MNYMTGVFKTEGEEMPDQMVPLTEPEIVKCLFVSGIGIEIAETVVRFVGWAHTPSLGGEAEERRIVVRFAMSNRQARNFQAVLRKGLSRGGH